MQQKKNSTRGFLRRKIMLSALTAFVMATGAQAQMQYNQWAFGSQASHDFITNNPLPTAPLINSGQEAAMWCDGSGNLMFYTDAQSIYNVVTGVNCINCLNGDPNGAGATQGALIVPMPGGSSNDFYIFTVSDRGMFTGNTNNGLSWYTYNVATNALSGPTRMGFTPGTSGSFTTEGLTAVPHPNGIDYWIIVKPVIFAPGTPGVTIGSPAPTSQPAGATNNSIYAYRVTSLGVSALPVVSDAAYGPDFLTGNNFVNEIKCSPDGQYACITNRITAISGNTMLYRFNSMSGEFQFLQALPMLTGYAPFGSSFSPNSRVLYVCGHYNNVPPSPPGGAEVLRQYDLTDISCNPFTTPPFCDFVSPLPFNSPAFRSTQLQLTPKGTIFRVRNGSANIDVISTPNNIGCTNINYFPNIIPVGNAPGETCRQGLPNNIDAVAGPSTINPWPKTTVNTVNRDDAAALDTDQHGAVYSTGTFEQSTQFESTTITGGTGTKSTYVVKYKECDEGFEWVARAIPTTATGHVVCFSLDVFETVSRVYVTGRYRGNSTFFSAAGVSCPGVPINITGNGIFVAVYNYNGCLLGVNTIPDDASYIHSSSHITTGQVFNPTTGFNEPRVYVAINETPLVNDHRIRIHAFVATGPGSLSPAWIVPLRGSPSAQAIDINIYGTRLAVTGTYDRDIFWNTSMTSFATTPTGVYEAFVATMLDQNGFAIPTNVAAQTLGFVPTAAGPTTSSGSGVHVIGTSVFLTGTYTGTTSSVFGTGIAMAGNGSVMCAYAIRLDPAPSSTWAHTFRCDGVTFAHDVVARQGSTGGVYFTGTWVDDSVFTIDNTDMPAVVPGKKHMYTVKIMLNGTFTGSTCWQNHSYVSNDATDLMKPARIAVFTDQWIYVNGSYKGTGQMYNDFAFNSPLTSTPATFNSFVWRYAVANGISLRENGSETEEESEMGSATVAPKIFPNPVQTTLTIQLSTPGESANIEIYNSAGQLMTSFTTSASNETVDVSDWAVGIYFVRIESEGEVTTEKFIRN